MKDRMKPVTNFFPLHSQNKEIRSICEGRPQRIANRDIVSSHLSSPSLGCWSEVTKAGYGRVAAVSQRVINYPDSFGAARALLSIKAALGRGNFLRAACYSGDRDTSRGYFARHARPFAKRN